MVSDDKLQLLQGAITWRPVTDSDLVICETGASSPPDADAIFIRNAVKRLFNHYYAQKDDQEIANFARLIDDYMSRDSRCRLFYGREFRKILAYMQRKGETARARQMLESYLVSLGVLSTDGGAISIGQFSIGGDYSSSWAVIFLDVYTKLLAKQGDTELASTLLVDSVNSGGLRDDAVILLNKTLGALGGSTRSPKFLTITLEKSGLDPRYLCEPTIELSALAYLKNELGREGVFAEVDLWRLILAFIQGELSVEALDTAYRQMTDASLPASFCGFLLTNRDVLSDAFAAMVGATFGAVGFPDLILYDEHNFRDLLLIEVKDVNDRLRPHQEAVLGCFAELGMQCRVLQFS